MSNASGLISYVAELVSKRRKMKRMIVSLFVLGLFCCNGQEPVVLGTYKEPTGQYSLIIELSNRGNSRDKYILMFKLTDHDGRELDYIRTGASDVQKWAVTWYDDKTIILNSADIGTYSWTIGSNGKLVSISLSNDMRKKGGEAYEMKHGHLSGLRHLKDDSMAGLEAVLREK